MTNFLDPIIKGPSKSDPAFAPGAGTITTTPVAVAPTGGQGLALTAGGTIPVNVPATAIQVLTADPTNPVVGQIWYRSDTSRLSIRHDTATTKTVLFA